jgi:LemA protein
MKNLLIVLALLLVVGGLMYNSMVKPRNLTDNAWANVQSAYQKRMDQVNQLVKVVEGAANFEKSTLTEVINARAKATQITVDPTNLTPEKLKELSAAQGQLSQALGRLMVVSEQYPQLKTNQNFLDLQNSIREIENQINTKRDDFNKTVLDYNNAVTTFPRNLFAGIFGFAKKAAFEADKDAQKAPDATINIK